MARHYSERVRLLAFLEELIPTVEWFVLDGGKRPAPELGLLLVSCQLSGEDVNIVTVSYEFVRHSRWRDRAARDRIRRAFETAVVAAIPGEGASG